MDSSGLHLPLNLIDTNNQPPPLFLYVQDGCALIMVGTWTAAYVLYVYQGHRDKSYGMPIVALCANFAWEITYGILYPSSVAETLILIPWIVIDVFVMITTFRYGPEEWKSSPMIANKIGVILSGGSIFMLALHWAFVGTCPNRDVAAFYSAFLCQTILGLSSIAHLMTRGDTRGHSFTIWLLRAFGSLTAVALFIWRYIHYPEDYPMVGSPMARLLFLTGILGDLAYLPVYMNVASKCEDKGKSA